MDQARHLAATGIEAHLACLFHAAPAWRRPSSRRANILSSAPDACRAGAHGRHRGRYFQHVDRRDLADAEASSSRDDREAPDSAAGHRRNKATVRRATAERRIRFVKWRTGSITERDAGGGWYRDLTGGRQPVRRVPAAQGPGSPSHHHRARSRQRQIRAVPEWSPAHTYANLGSPSARCARTARTWPRAPSRLRYGARIPTGAPAPGAIGHPDCTRSGHGWATQWSASCCCSGWDNFKGGETSDGPRCGQWTPPAGLEERDDGR